MNERIKELMKQALIPCQRIDPSNNMPYESKEFSAEKFAELIVKECCNAADMAYDAHCKYIGDYVGEYMGYGEEQGITTWRAK
jgi:hypothetical protein